MAFSKVPLESCPAHSSASDLSPEDDDLKEEADAM